MIHVSSAQVKRHASIIPRVRIIGNGCVSQSVVDVAVVEVLTDVVVLYMPSVRRVEVYNKTFFF
jgi:hypothetical protein